MSEELLCSMEETPLPPTPTHMLELDPETQEFVIVKVAQENPSWLSQSVEHGTPDIGVVSSSSTLCVEIT